jgi:D-sedoheptulose 7-phosphate isomerase
MASRLENRMTAAASAFIAGLFERHPHLEPCRASLTEAAEVLIDSFRAGGKLLVCGNGGSAADSEHIVGELMKGYRSLRPLGPERAAALGRYFPGEGAALAAKLQGALPAISLVSQVSLTSAVANDVGAEMVFAQQVFGYGRPGDVLLAISTSGNAANVLNAVRVGRAFGLRCIALTGTGGALGRLCDPSVAAPGADTAAIQENHMRMYHALCGAVEAELFPQ